MRHIDHVELAWTLLGELPLPVAFARLQARLVELAAAAGKPEKYDAALTLAYLLLVDERRRSGEPFTAFALRNRDLLDDGARLVAESMRRA